MASGSLRRHVAPPSVGRRATTAHCASPVPYAARPVVYDAEQRRWRVSSPPLSSYSTHVLFPMVRASADVIGSSSPLRVAPKDRGANATEGACAARCRHGALRKMPAPGRRRSPLGARGRKRQPGTPGRGAKPRPPSPRRRPGLRACVGSANTRFEKIVTKRQPTGHLLNGRPTERR